MGKIEIIFDAWHAPENWRAYKIHTGGKPQFQTQLVARQEVSARSDNNHAW